MDLWHGWRELDRILRGEATRLPELKRGEIETAIGALTTVLILLAMTYGVCMGCFAIFRGSPSAGWQVLASVVKVPALFVLTLVITFPSLYVFNALVGSRLTVTSLARLLVAALGVTTAVLASLGPIVAFFSASTTSYPFMKLLNVVVFAVSGFLGMGFLLQTLHRLSLAGEGVLSGQSSAQPPDEAPARPAGALDPVGNRVFSRHVRTVFRCWLVLFGLVGAQMGWVLRPFIGDPNTPFTWFRARESNIFLAILNTLGSLLSG